jgi:hypothetical protein
MSSRWHQFPITNGVDMGTGIVTRHNVGPEQCPLDDRAAHKLVGQLS